MIERLNELNRVLDAAATLITAEPGSTIPLDAIIRSCRAKVMHGLLPDHESTVQFAAELGLLHSNGDIVQIADDGWVFLSLNPNRYYELTPDQARFVAHRYYLNGKYLDECRSVFRCFTLTQAPPKLMWSEVDDAAIQAAPWLMSHLCQLGLLIRTDAGYESIPSSTKAIIDSVEEPKGLTEERLRELLLEKEIVGDLGEDLALAYERDRLRRVQCVVEAHCVRRISKIRVNAGYDIESFDAHAPTGSFDRYIEVKASRGTEIRFYWTENEMRVAEQFGSRYWIYFLGAVDPINKVSAVPRLFQDPIQSIMNNNCFIKQAQGLFVQVKSSGVQL